MTRLQCEPEGRDWEATRQKCNHCAERNLTCGPNFTRYDDPEVGSSARRRLAVPAGSDPGCEGPQQQDVQSANVASTPSLPVRYTGPEQGPRIDESRLTFATSPKDRADRVHDLSDEELRAEALSM